MYKRATQQKINRATDAGLIKIIIGEDYGMIETIAISDLTKKYEPATYAADGLRNILLKISLISLGFNVAIISGFDLVSIARNSWAFRRMK